MCVTSLGKSYGNECDIYKNALINVCDIVRRALRKYVCDMLTKALRKYV
jgi:hypothetical protein